VVDQVTLTNTNWGSNKTDFRSARIVATRVVSLLQNHLVSERERIRHPAQQDSELLAYLLPSTPVFQPLVSREHEKSKTPIPCPRLFQFPVMKPNQDGLGELVSPSHSPSINRPSNTGKSARNASVALVVRESSSHSSSAYPGGGTR
jgi:hypothetical protein